MMHKLLTIVRQAFSADKELRQVIYDAVGFTVVEQGETLARVAWTEIREIFAYKTDRGVYDDICLGFRVKDDGTFWITP
jgi:hypothetical protein